MNATRWAKRLGAAALALTAVGLAAPPADAGSGKSFRIESLVTEAVVQPDGSMAVSEQVTYRFDGGPFNFGIRSFRPAERGRITDFTAADDEGNPLPVIPPSTSVSGEWEWQLGGVSDRTVTYTLTYAVPDAIALGTDVGELYWQFVGRDHPGIGRVGIAIAVPGPFPVATDDTPDDDATVVRAWGHGPRNGTVTVRPDRVLLAVTSVPGSTFVEARVAIPATAFTGQPQSGPRLPTILAEEGSATGDTFDAPPEEDKTVGNVLAPAAAVAGFAGLGALWAKFGKEPKPDPMIGKYWREPLDDPPAVVLANQKKGDAPLSNAIGATLIDLAQRGYLTIDEQRHERLGTDKIVHRLRWGGKPTTDLNAYEQNLLQHVFLGRAEATLDDVTAWAKENKTEAQAFAKSFTKQVRAEFDARSYRARVNPKATTWLIGAAAAVAILGFVSSRMNGDLGLVAYISAGLIFVLGSILVINRTQRGADEKAKADSLRNFLRDFSNLEEAPAGHLILWERFLVYAVTLGVADELLDNLRVRLPSIAEDPAFSSWYRAPALSSARLAGVGTFANTFGATSATSFAPPSRSGGGGGFSGGGGGGGGGGGFGAR